MATIELRLNPRKASNYAFFCPVTKLHLTLANPVGITDRVSPYILRAVKSKTLIDINNVIDLATGTLKDENASNITESKTEQVKNEEPVKSETTVTQPQEELSQEVEVAVEEKKSNKRGKRTQNNPVDEVAR